MEFQGPADSCVINGKNMGWLNCTACSAAMGIEWATSGESTPSGCTVRRRTGDTIGGLMLKQVEPIIQSYGITTEKRIDGYYATPQMIASRLRDGKAFLAQGNTGVLIGTRHQSTAGWVNHCIWIERPTGWVKTGAGWYRPSYVAAYDPAADGRYDFARGPQTWSWATLLRFCAALRPNGDATTETIGPGKAWAMFLTKKKTSWTAAVPPKTYFWKYTLVGDYIVSRTRELTGGFSAECEKPRSYRVHSTARDKFPQDSYNLTELLNGSRKGSFIGAQYAEET